MDRKNLVLVSIVAGLVLGVSASILVKSPESRCEKTEDAITQRTNFSGALACFPPGVLDMNQSEEIEEGADLKCLCRQSIDGQVQIFAINKASP